MKTLFFSSKQDPAVWLLLILLGLYLVFERPRSAELLVEARAAIHEANKTSIKAREQVDSMHVLLNTARQKVDASQYVIDLQQQLNQRLNANYYQNKKSNDAEIDNLKEQLKLMVALQKTL